MIVGVDEAGKGPVLGSMFAAAVRVPDPADLPDGVDDSKRLSADRREQLAARLRENPDVELGVASIPADRIDDPETDMNRLTVAAHAEAVGVVADGGEQVVADAAETSERRFGERLADAVPAAVEVTAEHGADASHAVVGAASIVAKVARDDHVASLAERHQDLVAEHGPLGSGYPGDPATRAFLESYVASEGTVPPFARRSWQTSQRLLAEHEQSGLEEF